MKNILIIGAATGVVGAAAAGVVATGKLTSAPANAQSASGPAPATTAKAGAAPVGAPADTANPQAGSMAASANAANPGSASVGAPADTASPQAGSVAAAPQTANSEAAAMPPVPQALYADVVSVTPVNQIVTTPRRQCHIEKVIVHTKPKDPHNVAGTALGAAVGGILLNQLGGGVFRALATTAGVIGGGYAGNRIENSTHKGSTKIVTKERCVIAYNHKTIPRGYQVTYSIQGITEVVRMDHDPGRQIPIKDGKLDLTAYTPDRSGPQDQSPTQAPDGSPSAADPGAAPAGSTAPSASQAPSQGGRSSG